MELSEAKDILKEWLEYNKEHKDEIRKADTIIAVQETILKALDNSVSKDEVRKKIEKCVKRRQELANGHFWESPSNINEDTALVMAQTLYQELLGDRLYNL